MYILILPEWGLFTKSGLNCRIKGYMRCFSDLILLVFKDVQPEPNKYTEPVELGVAGGYHCPFPQFLFIRLSITEGDLISKKKSVWLKSLNIGAKSLTCEGAQESDLAPIFEKFEPK